MKDIIISTKRINIELKTWLICLLVAFLCNIGAIAYYQSPIAEILTSLGYVLLFSVFLYTIWSCIRIVKLLLSKIVKK